MKGQGESPSKGHGCNSKVRYSMFGKKSISGMTFGDDDVGFIRSIWCGRLPKGTQQSACGGAL